MIQSLASNPYHFVDQISLDIVGFFLLWIVALKLVLWPVDGRGELVVTVIRLVQFLDGVDNVSIDQTDCRQDGFVR